MPIVRGSGVIEKDKRYRNTWKIAFYLGEKDEQGRHKRAPKRTAHGTKGGAREALAAYIAEYEHSQDSANHTIAEYAWHFHELRRDMTNLSPNSYFTYAHALDADEIAAVETTDRILGDQ